MTDKSSTVSDEGVRPLLRVVKGNPTPEELAALVAVVAAKRATAAAGRRPRLRSAWGHPAGLVRTPVPTGRGGWRSPALPR